MSQWVTARDSQSAICFVVFCFSHIPAAPEANAGEPSERAVYISGRRYVTGQSLEGGAMIESIAPDAVVLRWTGQRYLLRWEHPPTPLGR